MADSADVVASVAWLEAGAGRVVVPPQASGTLQGAGLLSMDKALCEPIDPDDLQSLEDDPAAPLIERYVDAYLKLWDRAGVHSLVETAELALLTVQYAATMASLLTDGVKRDNYLAAVGTSYSNYVRDYFKGYLDLLTGAFAAVKAVGGCQLALAEFNAAVIFGDEDIDFDSLITELIGDCAFLMPVVQAFASWHAFHQKLLNDPLLVLGAVLEVIAEAEVLMVEKLADADVVGFIAKYVDDEVAIGEIHGTLIGIVIAEIVIDELLTLCAGKVVRGVRTFRRLVP